MSEFALPQNDRDGRHGILEVWCGRCRSALRPRTSMASRTRTPPCTFRKAVHLRVGMNPLEGKRQRHVRELALIDQFTSDLRVSEWCLDRIIRATSRVEESWSLVLAGADPETFYLWRE